MTETETTGFVEEPLDNIPEVLKDEKSWVPWRLEKRNGKHTKVLYQIDHERASSTDPDTWTTFESVVNACRQDDFFDGIGFVLHEGNPYCGADLDDVTEEQASRWINQFDSYTERSPSGNGFHIICKAEVPKGTNRVEGELYSSGRFFTMTGDVVRDTHVREAQDAADEFYKFLRRGDDLPREQAPSTSPTLTDGEVISLAENAKHGADFKAVYQGGGQFKSPSERDLSLANRLAFWTQDEAQIERIMRGSSCAREKWDKHRTYLRDTIGKAMGGLSETYTLEGEKVSVTVDGRKVNESAGDVISVSFGRRGGAAPPQGFHLTELGNAERFIAQHGENVRYCKPWEKWLVYTGSRWERDETMLVNRLAKETVRSIYAEAAVTETEEGRKALAKHAAKSESAAAIKAMLELARHEVPVLPDEMDAHPHLINTLNGTVDLKSGELREPRREDLLTKMAGAKYRPGAEAPTWEAFLERALPSADLRGFVHRASGYSATGDTSEQCILINHGAGANGKSTFQETVAAALGDYATRTPTDMLMARRFNGVPNDVARLKGARFVAASETEEGRRLDEARIKDLTGQDTISARYMRGEWFDFQPTHKLWLSTNHKPEIRGTDNAIWRRIRLISWDVTIPPAEQDRKLPEKLRNELEGVLAWVVAGCVEWQREGLRAPEEVRRATGEYRAEMDVLAAFLREECATLEGESTAATSLYEAYKEWCGETGERQEKQRKFGERLKERGYEKQRITSGANKGKYEYLNIALIRGAAKITVDGEPLEQRNRSGEQSFTRHPGAKNTSKTLGSATEDALPSEQSEPKNGISTGEIDYHEVMSEKGSLRSLRSPLPAEAEEDDFSGLQDLFDSDKRGEE